MSETERIYTVPLKEAWHAQRYRRSEKAVAVLRAFAVRHMKAKEVAIDTSVNEAIWARGIKSPPHRIRVKMTKDDEGKVTITMAEAAAEAEEKPTKEAKPEAKEAPKEAEPKPAEQPEAKSEPAAEPEAEPEAEAEKKE